MAVVKIYRRNNYIFLENGNDKITIQNTDAHFEVIVDDSVFIYNKLTKDGLHATVTTLVDEFGAQIGNTIEEVTEWLTLNTGN